MAALVVLVVMLIVLEIWVDGNSRWAKLTGKLSLIPLNLGLFWFIGFPIAVGLWTDIEIPFDSMWKAAGATLLWMGPAWLFSQWHDRMIEAQRDSDGRLRPAAERAAFRARERERQEAQWLHDAVDSVRKQGVAEGLTQDQAAGVIHILKQFHGVQAVATRSYADHAEGDEHAYKVRRAS